jgi:hypothetical protein
MRLFAKVVIATAALAFIAGVTVKAQSLGEVAARTQKEKEAKAKPAKVFTETDLRKPASSGTVSSVGSVGTTGATDAVPSEGAAPAASPAPGTEAAAGASPAPPSSVDGKPAAEPTPKQKTPDEERAEQVAAWREKMDKAQADVNRLSTEVAEIEASLAANIGAQYSPVRAKVQARLDAAKSELAAARQSVESLTEEGRRAGMR